MFNCRAHQLLLAVITTELINIGDVVSAAPSAPVSDLSEVLIFDSDPPSVNSSEVQIFNLTKSLAIPNITEHDAEKLLEYLGYHEGEPEGLDVSNRFGFVPLISLRDRIINFQRDSGLKETGVLDDDTKLTMGTPHCGARVSEKVNDTQKWNKNTLTYRIGNHAAGVSPSTVSAYIKSAFNEWSKVTNLNFVESNDRMVDIEILFVGSYHQWPKNGQRCELFETRTLAHAYGPGHGDIHFNTKFFFLGGTTLKYFLDTAIHEIGHSLGLKNHSISKGSIMHREINTSLFGELQPEDIDRVQALYGVRRGTGSTFFQNAPKFCSLTKYDAALDDEYGNWYIFSGNYYFSAISKKSTGTLISSRWPGITGSIDAAFRFPDGRTYFFKGSYFWRYRGSRLEPGYPRLISDGFPGLPDNVDAIFVDGQGILFVLKGSRYWVYDFRKDHVHSYNLGSLGGGLPYNVDSGINSGSKIVVFKARKLYRFKNGTFREHTNLWMSC